MESPQKLESEIVLTIEEENEASKAVRNALERELARTGIQWVTGIAMDYDVMSFLPRKASLHQVKAELSPEYRERLTFKINLGFGCYWFCLRKSWRSKRIYLQMQGKEIIYLDYKRPVCCFCCEDRKKLKAEVFLAKNDHCLGSISYEDVVTDGAQITDYVSGNTFTITSNKRKASECIRFRSISGAAVATGKTTAGETTKCAREWENYELHYNTEPENSSLSTKAVILAAFFMWIHTQKEKHIGCKVACTLILVFLILCGVVGVCWRFLD